MQYACLVVDQMDPNFYQSTLVLCINVLCYSLALTEIGLYTSLS